MYDTVYKALTDVLDDGDNRHLDIQIQLLASGSLLGVSQDLLGNTVSSPQPQQDAQSCMELIVLFMLSIAASVWCITRRGHCGEFSRPNGSEIQQVPATVVSEEDSKV